MRRLGASSPGRSWHVYANNEVKGPYAEEDVRSLLQMNLVAADAQFSCGGPWVDRQTFLLYADQTDDELVDLEPVVGEVEDDVVAPQAVQGGVTPANSGGDVPEPSSEPAQVPAAAIPVRDRIVVIGRRRSGKTIYLAELYHQLWKSRDGLCMKALSGRSHKELMSVHETMRRGQWPQATQKETILHMEFELQYKGRSRVLVGLDYAGEVFRDAFVNDDTESPQAKALITHIDRALALILLIDPAVAVSSDADAVIDDDFGIVQAIQRVRDWPGGEDVPIVLLLTKADQNRHLFSNKESTRHFAETHYPAMIRTLKGFKAFHVSAVQATADKNGNLVPRSDSTPINVLESLKYCLDRLDANEEREQIRGQQQAEQAAMERMLQYQAEAERKSNLRFAALLAGIVTIGVCIMILILVFKG